MKPTMWMHALNRMARRCVWWIVLVWWCSGCAIQSAPQVVAMHPTVDTWAWAVSFVGSEGDTQRILTGITPNTRFRVAIQARLVTGHMRLLIQTTDTSPVLHVYPNRLNQLATEVTSDALGQLVIDENSDDARGGEYQVWLYTIANQ